MLAIGRTGLRRIGLVVLDRRGRVCLTRILDLRRKRGHPLRLSYLRETIDGIVRYHCVAGIMLEAPTTRRPYPAGFPDTIHSVVQDHGLWFQERSPFGALRAVGIDGERHVVVAELAAEYPEVAQYIDFSRPSFFRHRDHERDVIPLIHAFALAHVVALEASRGAARISNLIPQETNAVHRAALVSRTSV
ncbi:MAG: hypothetical protein U0414_31830 [Polyangiaceae bacterium]